MSVGWPLGLKELSSLLGVAPQRLFALANRGKYRYLDIYISKSNGGKRAISIPITELKGIQRLLIRNLWNQFPVSQIAHGYKRRCSIVTAAKEHLGPSHILKVDIHNYFPSITAKRIYGYLRKQGVPSPTSFIITRLVTHNDRLPQGAPTSPGLSNAICYALDLELSRLANSWQLKVTRYSDDIIFSGPRFNWKIYSELVKKVIRRHGFKVNNKKIRYFSSDQSQRVLGLLVDKSSLRMTRNMRRIIRAAFFKAGNQPTWGVHNLDHLRGYAEFYKMVYGANNQYHIYRSILITIKQIKTHEPRFLVN